MHMQCCSERAMKNSPVEQRRAVGSCAAQCRASDSELCRMTECFEHQQHKINYCYTAQIITNSTQSRAERCRVSDAELCKASCAEQYRSEQAIDAELCKTTNADLCNTRHNIREHHNAMQSTKRITGH